MSAQTAAAIKAAQSKNKWGKWASQRHVIKACGGNERLGLRLWAIACQCEATAEFHLFRE